jgi:hypothetical protein
MRTWRCPLRFGCRDAASLARARWQRANGWLCCFGSGGVHQGRKRAAAADACHAAAHEPPQWGAAHPTTTFRSPTSPTPPLLNAQLQSAGRQQKHSFHNTHAKTKGIIDSTNDTAPFFSLNMSRHVAHTAPHDDVTTKETPVQPRVPKMDAFMVIETLPRSGVCVFVLSAVPGSSTRWEGVSRGSPTTPGTAPTQ